ncbi:ferritin-like domain-containing protein [Sphingomonas sp. PB2P19]|uniref:ferritin-like domain-containing protein n=1 Tax=Sphingomonas rhamnosi TaxID=3096156 RepID=UPI002FCAAEE5
MQTPSPSPDRRQFLRMTAGFSAGALLAGCGGGGGGDAAAGDTASAPIVVVPAPTPASPPPTLVAEASHPLNLALTLAYVGAQYYGYAARGTGLSSTLTAGIGRAGGATGARQANFSDPLIAAYAAELADDKQRHVERLRTQTGALAAAQPVVDLSGGANGAFSVAARGSGIIGAGASFDPYAGDDQFLLGAFLVENAVAATYRTLLGQTDDPAVTDILSTNLADAIYHGGLVRTLLDGRATANPSVAAALTGACTMLSALDGSNVGDQSLTGATGLSSNIQDAEGRPIPFTRATAQVLRSLYLSSSGIGGFLPAGINGVAV